MRDLNRLKLWIDFSVLKRNQLEGFKALPYFVHTFFKMEMTLLAEKQWWDIRMLLPLAILLLGVWTINYVQLPIGQTPILWSEERRYVTHQSWNGKYHQKVLCYCTFVKSLSFYSKVEICFLKATYVDWKLFRSAVNKEAVGRVDRCPAHLSQRIMKKKN